MSINLKTPEMERDPYPAYAGMRRAPGATEVAHGLTNSDMLFFTRHADVMSVLKDPRFANDARRVPGWKDWSQQWYIPSVMKLFLKSLALLDDPDHGRLRALVHKAFTPSMIQDMNARMQTMADELLDDAARKPVTDLMAAYALPLPLNVICDLMGVDKRDRGKFHRWMANTITDISTDDPIGLVTKMTNAVSLGRFLKKLARARRADPGDDLTSALVRAEENGSTLSEEELLAMLMIILFAGHETTVSLIGAGTLALLQNPQQFALLKENPDLMESAIEELLRYASPVLHIAHRYALEDVMVGATHVPQYSTVLLGVAAANRDETVFTNPDTLDITRKPNRHIAFGFGAHYCLGAPLARLEAKIAFTTLFRRYPNLTLAAPVESLHWHGAPALRGLKKLPIRLKG